MRNNLGSLEPPHLQLNYILYSSNRRIRPVLGQQPHPPLSQRCVPSTDCLSLPPTKMPQVLLHWLALGMQPGSTKLASRRRLCGLLLHPSLVDPDSMPQPSQWSRTCGVFVGGREEGEGETTGGWDTSLALSAKTKPNSNFPPALTLFCLPLAAAACSDFRSILGEASGGSRLVVVAGAGAAVGLLYLPPRLLPPPSLSPSLFRLRR